MKSLNGKGKLAAAKIFRKTEIGSLTKQKNATNVTSMSFIEKFGAYI